MTAGQPGARIRAPAVAGTFYPAGRGQLKAELAALLADAHVPPKAGLAGVVAPHAGYMYSGPVAANAFGPLAASSKSFDRVLLLGPPHYVPVSGVAATQPDNARQGPVQLPGVRLWCIDTGGSGEALIALHAATGSSQVWEHQIPAFTAGGYRAWALEISPARKRRGRHRRARLRALVPLALTDARCREQHRRGAGRGVSRAGTTAAPAAIHCVAS